MTGVQTCALPDRKSTRLNSSHTIISYAVFCLKKKLHPADRGSRPLPPGGPDWFVPRVAGARAFADRSRCRVGRRATNEKSRSDASFFLNDGRHLRPPASPNTTLSR